MCEFNIRIIKLVELILLDVSRGIKNIERFQQINLNSFKRYSHFFQPTLKIK